MNDVFEVIFWSLFGATALFIVGTMISMFAGMWRDRRPPPTAPKRPAPSGTGGTSDETWGLAGISATETSAGLETPSSDSGGSDLSSDSGGGGDFSGGGGESGGGGASGGWND